MRLLFNWYYHREDLTRYLSFLAEEHDIFFIDRFHHDGVTSPHAEVLYWGNYSNPYELLSKVRPDKVIFSDIESFYQLALNIAARNLGIPTFILQHGTRGAYEVIEATSIPRNLSFSSTSKHTIRFFLSSVRWKNWRSVARLIRFSIDRKRYELTTALRRNQFELRRPDWYIEFSEYNAGYHRERDNPPSSRIILIGNPAFDEYFQRLPKYQERDYALLIDAPFVEASNFTFGKFTQADKYQYLKKLNDFFRERRQRLYVKLHPLSFSSQMPSLDNIVYIRDGDIATLVGESKCVVLVHFGTWSTPIVFSKRFYVFSSGFTAENPIYAENHIQVHSLLNFSAAALGEPHEPLPWSAVTAQIGFADGQSRIRLAEILLRASPRS